MLYDKWVAEAKKLDTPELKKLADALQAALDWPPLKEAYVWPGLGSIQKIVEKEYSKR